MSNDKLNDYGDDFTPTKTGHGVDISSQRQDALDTAALEETERRVRDNSAATVVDLGGGFGAHAIRMAQAGADVLMIDVEDTAAGIFDAAVKSGQVEDGKLAFLNTDFAALNDDDLPDGIDVLYSQRAIHYVPYETAEKTLKLLFNKMAADGRVFMSAAGYDTEYGKTYPDRDKPVRERFSRVTKDMREKHGIHHKIVTYSEDELATLLAGAGFTDVKVTSSAFGNIKASARKPAP